MSPWHSTKVGLSESHRPLPGAERFLWSLLAVGEKNLGPEHPDLSRFLHDLATPLKDRGRYEEAEPLSRRTAENSERRRDSMARTHVCPGAGANVDDAHPTTEGSSRTWCYATGSTASIMKQNAMAVKCLQWPQFWGTLWVSGRSYSVPVSGSCTPEQSSPGSSWREEKVIQAMRPEKRMTQPATSSDTLTPL
jgi:hypothetical protein